MAEKEYDSGFLVFHFPHSGSNSTNIIANSTDLPIILAWKICVNINISDFKAKLVKV